MKGIVLCTSSLSDIKKFKGYKLHLLFTLHWCIWMREAILRKNAFCDNIIITIDSAFTFINSSHLQNSFL